MSSTPTPLQRTSVPIHSRRLVSHSTTRLGPQISVSRLLLGSLAVTASKAWILHGWSDGSDGIGWMALAYWGGRCARCAWDHRRGSKGKRKEVEVELQLAQIFASAVQSLLLFLSVRALGPLQTSVLVLLVEAISLAYASGTSGLAQILPSIGLLLLIAVHHTLVSVHPLADLLSITLLTLSTSLLPIISFSASARVRQSKVTSRLKSPVYRKSAVAMGLVIILWTFGLVSNPNPFHDCGWDANALGYLVGGALTIFLPLSSAPNGANEAVDPPLRTNRDKLIYILAIPVIQFFALRPPPSLVECFVIVPAFVSTLLLTPARLSRAQSTRQWSATKITAPPSSSTLLGLLPPNWRPHLQTILRTPTSSRIFYFLLLNLAYMGVQMAYGVLTNSLGLISDAIHMLFDCLGLAVGLWASVAATWKPDGRYTFGYSRVETLSGFANGCFLILISVFIIFEAIQRVLDPPEMDTHQLLLVSGIGLAINLWGMYATGGHHHHGHSHSHDDHSHAVPQAKADHNKPSGDAPSHNHGNEKDGHSHVHHHTEACAHDHAHSHSQDEHHEDLSHHNNREHPHDNHGHGHSHGHDHSHDEHDHAHSHNMRGVFLHVLADTLGSVGVIVSTIMIRLTGWTGFDPIASLFIAALIVASVVPLVIDSGRVLCLDVGESKEEEIRTALAELATVDGLANYSAPRFWPRCEGQIVGSIHIQVAPSPSSHDPSRHHTTPALTGVKHQSTIYANIDKVVARVEKVLKKRIRGLGEIVIQVEGCDERLYCSCMTGGR